MQIDMTEEQWERVRDSISDILCWVHGFNAAHLLSDTKPTILGIDGLVNFNCRLKDEIANHDRIFGDQTESKVKMKP